MKTIAPRIIFTILFIVVQVVFVPTLAQNRNENRLVEIEIVPNRSDRTYKLGEDVTFEVRAYRAGVALSGVSLTYAIGPEKMPSTLSGSVVMQDKCVQLDAGTMTEPGFMTCSCTIEMEGESYSNYVNVGFSPEEIVPTQTMPDDFEKFWDKSLKKSAKIPLEPQLTLVPEKCTAQTNVYHVQLQHWRKDTYLYGWLCVPKKEGRYPAVLCVPGAGVKLTEGGQVMLYTYTEEPVTAQELVCIPDVTGQSIAQAATLLRQRGLDMEIEGTGFATRQEPAPDEYVPQGTVIKVSFEMPTP